MTEALALIAVAALAVYTASAFHRVRQQLKLHTDALNETRIALASPQKEDQDGHI